MKEFRAVDVPSLRDRAADQIEQPDKSWIDNARTGHVFWTPLDGSSPERWAPALQRLHAGAVRQSELFFVSDQMTELARAASASLPALQIDATDLPAPAGFMVLGAPLDWVDEDGDLIPCRAISWQPVEQGSTLHVVTWGDMETFAQMANPELRARYPDQYERWVGETLRRWPLGFDFEFRIRLGATLTDENATGMTSSATVHSMRDSRFLKTVWMLMQQELAIEEPVHYDRAMRRRAAREGRELPNVRVISLRRARREGAADTGEGGRQYHHQWLVGGHWRQQWYAKRQVHRPVWIAPYVKGPAGAPILESERVYALRK